MLLLVAAFSQALTHESWMLHALRLAERGRLSTAPNPWVGCVIVGGDGESVLAEGFHKKRGALSRHEARLFFPLRHPFSYALTHDRLS
jgi:hypothetical protein